jgi:hypothetical protein
MMFDNNYWIDFFIIDGLALHISTPNFETLESTINFSTFKKTAYLNGLINTSGFFRLCL